MNFQDLINYKDFDTLRTEAFTRLKALNSKITNLNLGGKFRTFLELALQPVADFYDLLLTIIEKGYTQYTSGEWLELKAEEMGLEKQSGIKTIGMVKMSREDTSGNVTIKKGSIVGTLTDPQGNTLQYITTEQVVFLDGESEISVEVEAEEPGSSYNIGAGYIVNLVTPIDVDAVINEEDWITTAGTDDETDEALRARCLSRWAALARGATKEAYRQWALEVNGVTHVSVDDEFPRGQGTVDVIISGVAGAPGEELIEEVQALLDDRKPICSDVLVKAPVEVPTDIDIIIYKHPLYGDADTIESEATDILNALYVLNSDTNVLPLGVGDNLVRARIIAEVMKISYVVDVELTTPADNIEIDNDEIATLNSLNITVETGSL